MSLRLGGQERGMIEMVTETVKEPRVTTAKPALSLGMIWPFHNIRFRSCSSVLSENQWTVALE